MQNPKLTSSSNWAWTPYFLTEKGTRTYLQTLYASLVGANENARKLISDSLDRIGVGNQDGNEMVRACFTQTGRWLRIAQGFCKSEESFSNQILEPSRIAAKFLLSVRERHAPSTTLEGFVFARTPEYYDNNFQSSMRILSAVCPELRTVLSLRCRASEADGIVGETVEISGIQPVPFVNRIHPTDLSFGRIDKQMKLDDLDFLKISIHDLSHISSSLAFENFCEINSGQAGSRRLGLPCVISGKILAVDAPYIWIQDDVDEQFEKLMITEFLVKQIGGNVNRLGFYKGKSVRLLAVTWYALGSKDPPVPEAFLLQSAEESDLITDDATGYLRLRGAVNETAFLARYPRLNVQTLSPNVSQADGMVRWIDSVNGSDSFSQEFLKQQRQLSDFRSSQGSAWIWSARPSRVFDRARLKTSFLARKISRNDQLWASILEVVRTNDFEGRLPDSLSELKRSLSANGIPSADETIGWLRGVSILVKSKTGVALHERGVEAAYLSSKAIITDMLRRTIWTTEYIDLFDLEVKTQFPPSILLKSLVEFQKRGIVSKLNVDGSDTSLFWIRKSDEISQRASTKKAIERLHSMYSRTLQLLSVVPYSLGTLRLAQSLSGHNSAASCVSTNALLVCAQSEGLVEKTGTDLWLYPWKKRITDFLKRNPLSGFTLESIIEKNGLPTIEQAGVSEIIHDLKTSGLVIEILPSQWAASVGDFAAEKSRLEAMLRLYCKAFVKERLERGDSEDRLLGEMQYFLVKLMGKSERRSIDLLRFCEENMPDIIKSVVIDQRRMPLKAQVNGRP